MIITGLTRELYKEHEGEYPNLTIKGIAALYNGKVVGILGITVVDGRNFIACSISDMRNRDIIIVWRYFKENYIKRGSEYYSVVDNEKPTAESFNEHFGFYKLLDNVYILRT